MNKTSLDNLDGLVKSGSVKDYAVSRFDSTAAQDNEMLTITLNDGSKLIIGSVCSDVFTNPMYEKIVVETSIDVKMGMVTNVGDQPETD